MAQTSPDIRQSQTRVLQDQLNATAVVQMDSTLASINSELTVPGRLIAASTPSLVVNVGTGTPVNPNTSKNRTLPLISNTYVNFAGGTITFPSGTGTITVSPGVNLAIVIGASQFMAITVQLDSTGNLNLSAGTATSSLSTALAAASPGSSSFLSLGIIVIQTNGSSVIQNITNAMLYQFGSGTGGSGSGGSGLGDDLASTQFRGDLQDTFPESPAQSSSSIDNSSAHTNASYNAGKNMYAISYDASKTASTTGTALTMSGAPAFTVATGDVVVNQATGEVKKITALSSQTAYTLESAFASNLASQAVTVSQAVHTKDIYNLAVDSNGNTIASAFSASPTFSEIAVFYKDNSTAGSNQWAINTVANVAHSDSVDGSTWTIAQKRATNVTDQYQSTVLSAAGSSLYLRFFSNKTSGNGTVNLIMYKAYMQKLASSPSGGVQFAAYGTTNNSTTSIGCTIATVGGKTQITLTGGNQYAVGVNPTQTYGSCDVLLNGQLIPRFISGSVPSTDSYFTELSGTVIQLDRDYSSLQVEVQVLVRAQVVDASTTNTTAISAIQAYTNAGFQSFVSQTDNVIAPTVTAGTPVAGTFYSTITNRASMPDLSQDLKPRFGIERLSAQQIYPLQNEIGPNGETVWGVTNDTFGQIRVVGIGWANDNTSAGAGWTSTTTNDYVEVTFYGTGLNMLWRAYGSSSFDVRVSVDGGSEGSNLVSGTFNGVLNGRSYALNTVTNLVSGLTLGIHTVKIRTNQSSTGQQFYGFEILNQNATATNVSVNSGIGYYQGQKLAGGAQTLFAYSAPVTGTTGGRVLVYQNANGSIGTAFTANASSPSYYTSANHTNEEIARIYHWREFGAGRGDDFSTLINSARTTGFTLEDGTTTFTGTANTIADMGGGSSVNGVFSNTTNDYLTFTFVGTGLDLRYVSQGTVASTYSLIVDGTTVQSGITGLSQSKVLKIASGLPYGTHTVKLLCTTLSGAALQAWQWIVYQPKTPSLPSGAVQVGSYNVMANYVASSTVTGDPGTGPSQGVLYKTFLREAAYFGSGWSIVQQAAIRPGFFAETPTSGDAFSYTFFGTGIEISGQYSSVAPTVTVQIDGSAYTGAATLSGTGGSWTPGTSTWVFGSTGGALQISGLSLGVHTIKVTKANSTDIIAMTGIFVITPVHSVKSNLYYDSQNSLPIGSNAISDDRQITPIKQGLTSNKSWSQGTGENSSPTISTSTFVPISDLSVTIKTNGGALEMSSSITFHAAGSAGAGNQFQFYVDGVAVGQSVNFNTLIAGDSMVVNLSMFWPVGPGIHKVDVYGMNTNGSTITFDGTQRILKVREI